MKHELIDVVDENDNMLKTIERTPEWNKTRPTIYRVVQAFVFTTEGKLVVQQRSRNKPFGPLLFDSSVGGLVTSGLSYEKALQKEAGEELGIQGEFSFVSAFKEKEGDKTICHIHLFEKIDNGPYTNWEDEAERLEFMTLEEAITMAFRFPYLLTGGFAESLKQYKAAKGL